MKKLILFLLMFTCITCLMLASSCSKKKNTQITTPGSVTSGAPELTSTAAVTQINEDKAPMYETVSIPSLEIYNGDLLLIDKNHPYTYKLLSLLTPTELDALSASALKEKGFSGFYSNKSDNYLLRSRLLFLKTEAYSAFSSMMEAFVKSSGKKDVQVCYAYSLSDISGDAAGLYDEAVTGLSVDINVYTNEGTFDISHTSKKKDYFEWFSKNAAYYGFILNGASGHLRYVGAPHAQYMNENGLFLSEYLERLKKYSVSDPLEIEAAGERYYVYYAAASSGAVSEIIVPAKAAYEVSGDNASGFVVTVRK